MGAHVSSISGGGGRGDFGLRGFAAGLLDDAAHGVGRLRAVLDPMINTVKLHGGIVFLLLRVVGADEFEEFTVAGAMLVRHHNAVVRTVLGAVAAESDDHCHNMFLS